jgi:hypothetical protein|tara:strand:+ start:5686 stop:5904 length:219 start_codon:yes stop_codon:yes gene_type:complete
MTGPSEMVPDNPEECDIQVYGFWDNEHGPLVALTAMPPGTDTSGPMGSFVMSPDAAVNLARRILEQTWKITR